MFRKSILQGSSYAQYRYRNPYYAGRRSPNRFRKAMGVHPFGFEKLDIDKRFRGVYFDHKHSLYERENLQESEDLRHPREVDYYQDATYHSQWEVRALGKQQKKQLTHLYPWMRPGYAIEPWIWYPGDEVVITSGVERGKRGRIRSVFAYKNEIIVDGINIQMEEFPATEDRPKQIVHNPFPIPVHRVKHIDPTNGQPCTLRVLTVLDKEGCERKVRISKETGAVLEIPKTNRDVSVGDPLLDTAYHDAATESVTAADMDAMVASKVEALERFFVSKLKDAFDFQKPFLDELARDQKAYQWQVWTRAKEIVAETLKAEEDKRLDEEGGVMQNPPSTRQVRRQVRRKLSRN